MGATQMTDIIESLHQDHVHMAQIAAIVERELATIEDGRTADFEALEDIMRYVTGYPDTYHHPTEDIVFERLKLRMPESIEEVDAILSEHRQVIEAGIRFLDAVRAVQEDVVMIRNDFTLIGRDYLSLLARHMNIEEARLFPLAKSTLTDEDWQELNERIEQRPDPLFGASLDDDYRRLRCRIEAHRDEDRDSQA
jgi:hemerythrin-like domain-containing protein